MTSDPFVPSGQTRVAGLFGYPARYSLSPALHNAAYRAMGVDATYVVFPVEPNDVEVAVESVRALELMGVSVTLPHKEAVIPFVDELSPEAQRLQAVNCIHRNGKRLVGHNTDGAGFVAALRTDCDLDPAGARVVVIGAGGAARAIVAGLGDAGAAEIVIVNRSRERGERAARLVPMGRVGDERDVAAADLVVNATPIGMEGAHGGQLPVAVDDITEKHVVVDAVYHPSTTPLLAQASARGARTANGLGMLIHQAAIQIELWTGRRPPVDVMRAALLRTGSTP